MNPNPLVQQNIALAQQRLARARLPGGAQRGLLAGQQQQAAQQQAAQQQAAQQQAAQQQALQQQALQQQAAQQQALQQVPQGAEAAALAGCGPDGCGTGYIPSPFAGLPYGGIQNAPYLQPQALLGIIVQPAAATPTTLEISCGNTFFNACGGRYFGNANENVLTEITSGFDTRNQLCPGSGIDAAFFVTTDCYCPFDFGCFSQLAPLLLTFDPIDTQSTLAPFNFVLVGDRLEFDGCFPYPPGLMPQPVAIPGIDWVPPTLPPGGPQMAAPGGPVAANPYGGSAWPGGSPWSRRMTGRW